jgi:hypothetical protein
MKKKTWEEFCGGLDHDGGKSFWIDKDMYEAIQQDALAPPATATKLPPMPFKTMADPRIEAIATPRTDAVRDLINADALSDDISTWLDLARQLERELIATNQACEQHAKDAVALQHEVNILYAFINREMQMTGSDPRIAELKKLIGGN